MSKIPPTNPTDEDPLADLEASQVPWWRRYSPHWELPWSSLSSLVLHIFLILLVIAAATPFIRPDPTPPTVDVLYIGEDADAAAGDAEGPPGEEVMAATAEESMEPVPETQVTEVQEVKAPDPVKIEVPIADVGKQVEEQESQLQEVKNRVNQVKDALAKNLDKGSPGGGGGGSGPTGRAARPARWVLRFNTSSPNDYLTQIGGLGASLAFPLQGSDLLYFEDPDAPSPRSQRKKMAGETRLYWVDDNAPSVAGVCRTLGIEVSPMMIAFLPQALEDRMLQLELAYANLEEDQIASTHFECVQRGGKYDVVVVHQIPK